MTRIYRYVLMHDGGMAPNPRGHFISLATCKPGIRKTAKAGDWVIGNFPSPHNERVAWAGVVEKAILVRQYGIEYHAREDALYPGGTDDSPERHPTKSKWYHPGEPEQRKDKTGNVLVFDPKRSWYFGGDGRFLTTNLAHLAARGIGFRVKGVMTGDVEQLEKWLNEQGPPGNYDEPRNGWDGPNAGPCSGKRSPKHKNAGC